MAPPRSTKLLRTTVAGVAILAAALSASAATTSAQAAPAAPQAAPQAAVRAAKAAPRPSFAAMQKPGVTANLWEWSWRSIEAECPRVHASGYDGVQVAPPQDSVKRTALGNGSDTVLHPWWEVYQVVDYNLTSRMGDEKQFQSMVSACRAAGVKVYVDAVINHTTGQGSTSYGGKSFTPYTYPDAGYGPKDFHYNLGTCPSKDGGIADFNNKTEVWNCNLVGLEDLNTSSAKVRGTLAAYLNKLIGYGVSGFRVDAGKHISPTDLDGIYNRLHRTKDGKRPFWSLEVGYDSPGVLSIENYSRYGYVLGFGANHQAFQAFKSYVGSDNVGDISGLATFGKGSGISRSDRTVAFITNHDTNHDAGNNLIYKDPQYLLATEWLLADGYGSPQVFSSFTYGSDSNQGPPSNADGIIDRASCANGRWTCDHVKPGVVAMVKFHQYVGNAAKKHVYASEFNVLAFSRGTKGWAGFNNNTADKAISVKTGLKKGTYCDAVTGGKVDGKCVGTTLTVNKKGRVTTILPARGAVAITKAGRL